MGRLKKRFICLLLALAVSAGSSVFLPHDTAEAASRPRKTSLTALTATTNGFVAYWNLQTSGTDGYELWFKEKGIPEIGTVFVRGNQHTYWRIRGLRPGKKYFVKIRTYRNGTKKKVFSHWSGKLSVTVRWSKPQKNARRIYRFFRRRGLDDIHIAAILGNIYPESHFDPTSVETIYNEPYKYGKRKQAAEKVDFKMKKMNKDYAERYPSIVRAGIGIMGWTDTKGMAKGQGGNTLLRKYAAQMGRNWYSLTAQMNFMWNGLEGAEGYKNWHARSRFEKAKTLNKATHVYLCYALSGWKCRKDDHYHEVIGLEMRRKQARRFYDFIVRGYYD